MEGIQGAHEVVAARNLLGSHEEDLDGRGVLLQALHDAARRLIVLGAAQIAAGDGRLLQVKHLVHGRSSCSTPMLRQGSVVSSVPGGWHASNT